MLVRVNVENFKSFEKETSLSMIPSNKIRKKTDHIMRIKRTPLLKSAVIYGANAAGKSNLIEVFRFIQHCVRFSLPPESVNFFCRTSKENERKSSVFELIIAIDNKFYAYGFSAILSKRIIESEWLYELYQNGSSKAIFERSNGGIESALSLSESEKARFCVYSEDLLENPYILFLSMMGRGRKIMDSSKLIALREVYEWIIANLQIITPVSDGNIGFQIYENEDDLNRVNKLIKTFDTGIDAVRIQKITMEEFKNEIPKEALPDVMAEIGKRWEEVDDEETISITMRSDISFFNIYLRKGKEPEISTLKTSHKKSSYDFSFQDESDGTRRIFALMDVLLSSKTDAIYVVDELDRSLHPKLTARFIELFFEIHQDHNTQLLFTTHEDSIMDQSLFRRDEIWFVERDQNNASNVYSLDNFKQRYDKKLSKAYLEGRYGAIPVFSEFRFAEEGE